MRPGYRSRRRGSRRNRCWSVTPYATRAARINPIATTLDFASRDYRLVVTDDATSV
jgi:hypothetical protein